MDWIDTIHHLKLDSDIKYLKGIGIKKAQLFNKLGIFTVRDLILYKPHRWEDFSHVRKLNDLSPGRIMVKGQVIETGGRYLGKRGMHLTEALIRDDTGYLRVVWFNQPYRAKALKKSEWYFMSGKYDLQYRHLQLINPSVELTTEKSNFEVNLIKGVYSTTAGLKNTEIYKALKQVDTLITEIKEIFPEWLIKEAKLKLLSKTLQDLHFPKTLKHAQNAKKDLGFRNLIVLSLSSQLLKLKVEQVAHSIKIQDFKIKSLIERLPFKLTNQQQELISQILGEMNQGKKVLNRLIQGDVGSGKTVVALVIAYNLMLNNYQVALIAPTQILAYQHLETALSILSDFINEDEIAILHSKLTSRETKEVLDKLQMGKIKLVIGTQSLLSKRIKFSNLGLVIIDEQHRFGVEQRVKLVSKTKPELCNILTLSATPIPRSLALVIYADLDISLLTQKPLNRLTVKTSVITLDQRSSRLQQILKLASPQNLIFVVCPSIEADAEDSLRKTELYLGKLVNNLNYVSLHGQMKSDAKEKIIQDFKHGKHHVLLTTSIIEAGIDILNANHIIIMSPEYFGLAQLHQMRGRVGRNEQQGYCYLCPYSNQTLSERLQAILEYSDGFKLSEIDLNLRGPGTLYGLKQSGRFEINDFFSGDIKTIQLAVQMSEKFIDSKENLKDYPELKKQINQYQQVTYLN